MPWDGFGFERKQILDYILDNNVRNVAAITGGSAPSPPARLHHGRPGERRVRPMPEFVGGSATSTVCRSRPGCPRPRCRPSPAVNPHIKFYDFVNRGYGVIEMSPSEAICRVEAGRREDVRAHLRR